MDISEHLPRRRLWPVFAAPGLLFVAAAAWCGFWFYASSQIDEQFEGWRTREARSGRTYDCASRDVSGFPFRFEVRCGSPVVSLNAQTSAQFATQAPLTARLGEILVVAQVYDPTKIIAEFKGPVSVAETGQATFATANWSVGQASVAGLPVAPGRISMAFDNPSIDLTKDGGQMPLLRAAHIEGHLRLAGGTPDDHPIVEAVVQSTGASLQNVHPVLAAPFNENLYVRLRGLKDFAPKTWPERFREIQQANGGIDIVESRFQQGDAVGVAAGTLTLTPAGYLSGELQMTVANFEQLIPALGLEKALAEGAPDSKVAPGVSTQDINKALGSLDRIIPGLGNIARKNVNVGLVAGLNMIGQPSTLEGKPARAITVKFADGAILLGPLRVAQTPALF